MNARLSNAKQDFPDFIWDSDGNPIRGFDPFSPGFQRMMMGVMGGAGIAPVDPGFAAALGMTGADGDAAAGGGERGTKKGEGSGKDKK